MTGFELGMLLNGNRGLIVDAWNIFNSVHIAIISVFFLISGRISLFQRLVMIFAYLCFMYANYNAQVDNYGNYYRIIEQIQLLSKERGADAAKAILGENAGKVWISNYLKEIYCGASIVSSLVFLLIGRFQKTDSS